MQTTFPSTIVSRHFHCSELIELFEISYYQDVCFDKVSSKSIIDKLNQYIDNLFKMKGNVDENTSIENIVFFESSIAELLFELISSVITLFKDWFNYWIGLGMDMRFKVLDEEGTFVMSFHP